MNASVVEMCLNIGVYFFWKQWKTEILREWIRTEIIPSFPYINHKLFDNLGKSNEQFSKILQFLESVDNTEAS